VKLAARALLTLLAVALSATATSRAIAEPAGMPIAAAAIDRTVARAMQSFKVPGMAVGIVKDRKLIYAKGYGVRELGKTPPVDIDTLFQIGSNTKAFTAAALAILVDRFSQGFGPELEPGGDQAVEDAIEGMTLRSISPLTDFSFDFQDLDFAKLRADSKSP
jgi:hypothetical protein